MLLNDFLYISNESHNKITTCVIALDSPTPSNNPISHISNFKMTKIVLCCDGTWCGKSTKTTTNIKIIANCFEREGNAKVRYFDGLGAELSDITPSSYIVHGALGIGIRDLCIEAYKYIVTQFQQGDKVWMYGLSRGAYTVRCVAAIINKVGILRNSDDNGKLLNPQVLHDLCTEAYHIYINKNPQYKPRGMYTLKFKLKYSYWDPFLQDELKNAVDDYGNQVVIPFEDVIETDYNYPPIEFLGLLDTVGSLGIPEIDPMSVLKYQFYDQQISSEVQHVYQALSTHDRLSVFAPCFAHRNPNPTKWTKSSNTLTEVWFPGAHYDVGRQNFILLRDINVFERMLRSLQVTFDFGWFNCKYTEEYSKNVFYWMVKVAKEVDPNSQLKVEAYDAYLPTIRDTVLVQPYRKNAYDKMLGIYNYIPLFHALFSGNVLVNRSIPPDREQTFYSTLGRNNDGSVVADSKTYRQRESGQLSRSFDIREELDGNSIKWTN